MFSNTNSVIQEFNVTKFFSDGHQQFERLTYCLPFVHLAAFPKCGTTTLYEMLVQHPLVTKSARKEGHFWFMFTEYSGTYKDKLLHSLFYLRQFQGAAQEVAKFQRSITIDASVSTLWKTLNRFEDESDISV